MGSFARTAPIVLCSSPRISTFPSPTPPFRRTSCQPTRTRTATDTQRVTYLSTAVQGKHVEIDFRGSLWTAGLLPADKEKLMLLQLPQSPPTSGGTGLLADRTAVMQVLLAAAVRSPRNFWANHESASPLGGDLSSSPYIRGLLLGISRPGGRCSVLSSLGLGGPPRRTSPRRVPCRYERAGATAIPQRASVREALCDT